MNEQMKDLLNDLGRKISETAETFSSKAGEVVEIQRLRSQIRTMERSNDRDLRDIGSMIYEKYKAGEVIDTEMVCICEEIKNRMEMAEELEQVIAGFKGTVNCPACGKELDKEMSYCPYCGIKMETEEKSCGVEEEASSNGEETCSCEEKDAECGCKDDQEKEA